MRNIYFEKAVKYVRLHGSLNLAVGGQAHDVLHGIEAYGIVPEEVYPGLNYGYDKPNFDEIDAVIKAYADAVIAAAQKEARPPHDRLKGRAEGSTLISARCPGSSQGQEYTPRRSPRRCHRPRRLHRIHLVHPPLLHSSPWRFPTTGTGTRYGTCLWTVRRIIDNSLEKGYTISWGTDK